jgi:hypothetical protein
MSLPLWSNLSISMAVCSTIDFVFPLFVSSRKGRMSVSHSTFGIDKPTAFTS